MTRYQNDRTPPAAGALKVCATELSPANGELLPTLADDVPLWAVVETAVLPELVQPVSPLSNPPLVIPDGGGGGEATVATSSSRVSVGSAAYWSAWWVVVTASVR